MNQMFKIFLLLFIFYTLAEFNIIDNNKIKKRNFGNYFQEESNPEYLIFQHPFNHQQSNSNDNLQSSSNSILQLFSNGMNMLLLKLGILGVIKGVFSLLFIGFVANIIILILKIAILKSAFLPFVIIPLFLYLLANGTNQEAGEEDIHEVSSQSSVTKPMVPNQRSLESYPLTSMPLQSMRTNAKSEQCLEKISCLLGALNNSSFVGTTFSEILKLFRFTPFSIDQKRMIPIIKAFDKGKKTLVCSEKEYKCENPEFLVHHGFSKLKIFKDKMAETGGLK